MTLDRTRILRTLNSARHRRRGALLETEGMALLEALGIAVPRRIEFPRPDALPGWDPPPLSGDRVVLKAVAPGLLHKTEAGAVRVVANRRQDVLAAATEMSDRLSALPLEGFMLCEFVPFEPSLGHELLIGLRWTDAFGPVVSVGPGGIHAEFLAGAFPPGQGYAVLSADLDDAELRRRLVAPATLRLVTKGQRGRAPELDLEVLAGVVRVFLEVAEALCPAPIGELEINPLVVSGGRLVALDVLLTFGKATPVPPPRPIEKLDRLLEPKSIAIVGVSERMNPGRIILQNTLRAGFDPKSVWVVKPGCAAIDGCRCVPSLEALPRRVDLAVLSISAAQVPVALGAIIDGERAESVILIPGGLEERPESAPLVARMHERLAAARATGWKGPLVNGGNCLGIRSVPGRVNTLFIPQAKLPLEGGRPDPLAMLSGSGAFAVSKCSKLARANPRYTITVGNQMDLTLADYLEHLERDSEIEVFAVYAEGFRPLDGRRFVSAARRITGSGRTVVLYAAGRTQAGQAAAASHTAAAVTDQEVTRQLAAQAGVLVADTLEDFEDLTRVSLALRRMAVRGLRLGAVSNAGYECVAIADNLGPFELASFAESTAAELTAVADWARLGAIITVRNPLDLTPILGDAAYEEVVRRVLADPGVDVGLVGCVPLTAALETLAPGPEHLEDVAHEGSLGRRLARLHAESGKPWVAVVDAGPLYDRMVDVLERGGVPTFRSADRALRILARYCEHRLGRPARTTPHTAPRRPEPIPV